MLVSLHSELFLFAMLAYIYSLKVKFPILGGDSLELYRHRLPDRTVGIRSE